MNTLIRYVQDAIGELKQVRWPTRQQAIRLSIIVVAFTLACTVLLGVLDIGLSNLLKEILTLTA